MIFWGTKEEVEQMRKSPRGCPLCDAGVPLVARKEKTDEGVVEAGSGLEPLRDLNQRTHKADSGA